MPELNLGSSYNPTGDPLFHMPYQLRIDAIVCGNSDSMAGGNETTRNNSRPVLAYRLDGSLSDRFHSCRHAGAQLGFSPNTLRERIKNGKMPYRGYVWDYE